MNFQDAYRYGMHLPSLGRLVRDMRVSAPDSDCRRGLRSAALFRLLAGGLTLAEAGAVLS